MKPVGATLSSCFSSSRRTSNSVNSSRRSSLLARSTVCWKNGSDRLTPAISIHDKPGRPSTTTASTGIQPFKSLSIIIYERGQAPLPDLFFCLRFVFSERLQEKNGKKKNKSGKGACPRSPGNLAEALKTEHTRRSCIKVRI